MMPFDWSTGAQWAECYRMSHAGQFHTYGRTFADFAQEPRGTGNNALFSWRYGLLQSVISSWKRNSILVVGAGFGYLLEAMLDEGFTAAFGTDTSAWIQANKGSESRADVAPLILDIDIRDAGAGQALRNAVGNKNYPFDAILTDDVLTSYNTSEAAALLDACEAHLNSGLVNRIVHIVDDVYDPVYSADYVPGFVSPQAEQRDPALWSTTNEAGYMQSLTLDAWHAIRPAHTWVSSHSGWYWFNDGLVR